MRIKKESFICILFSEKQVWNKDAFDDLPQKRESVGGWELGNVKYLDEEGLDNEK